MKSCTEFGLPLLFTPGVNHTTVAEHTFLLLLALERWIEPTGDEREAIARLADRFHFVITPYYAALMDPGDPACPIRRQVVPHAAELDDPAGLADPLDEERPERRLPRGEGQGVRFQESFALNKGEIAWQIYSDSTSAPPARRRSSSAKMGV